MIRRHLDLILILLLTIIVVILKIVSVDVEGGIFMQLTGAVFVLFAPGYAITSAVFKENVLEFPAKIALGIGISLSISIVGGIALYGMGALLTRTSWTIFLSIIILVGSVVAIVQRNYNTSYLPNQIIRQLAFSEILLLIFGVFVLAGSVYLSWRGEQTQAYVPFTEFWILPQTDGVSEIEIGLHSYERTDMTYNILVHINGRDVGTLENISVQPNQEWSITYTLPPKASLNETVAVYLYSNGDPINPYRWGQIHR